VFCRNVLIYFNRENVVTLLARLREWMPEGAHLFLGYSESLWQVTDEFHLVRLGDAFAYRSGVDPQAPTAPRHPAPAPPDETMRTVPPSVRPSASSVVRPAAVVSPPPRARRAAPSTDVTEVFAQGEQELDRGDHLAAVTSFRQAVFLEPDDPVAYLNLGLALEATGDEVAARRAFAAGRAALDRCDEAIVEAALEGYRIDELTRLFEQRGGLT
jgi:tetratricopeptide (TPR) repeat protein